MDSPTLPTRLPTQRLACPRAKPAPSRALKNPAYCGERSLRDTGGLVAPLLNVAPRLRFRCSLLGRPSRFALTRLATAGFFSTLLRHECVEPEEGPQPAKREQR